MAYYAADSLIQTIERLENSHSISIVQNSSPAIMKFLCDELFSLLSVFEEWNRRRINMERVSGLDEQIREIVCKFEDTLIFHVSNQFGSQEQIYPLLFSLDLEALKQDVDSFAQTINEMKEKYIDALSTQLPEEIDVTIDVFGGNEPPMIGLSDQFMKIKDQFINLGQSKRMIVSLVGMAGIGKTTLAKKLFHDPLISSRFDILAFVQVGPKYQLERVLLNILEKVNGHVDEEMLIVGGKDKLVSLKEMMYKSLMGRKYLIVLDDVWDEEVWDELKRCFPDGNSGSQILLTTRLQSVAKIASWRCKYNIRFLDKKESWHLLRNKVFGEESLCPSELDKVEKKIAELEKVGKKIAEKCEGLPLTIVTVAGILSKADKTLEYWNEVAENQTSVFTDAYEQMLKVLYSSYNYLPQHLKSSFLYMGAFPQSYETPCSKLINLWRAEGLSGAHLDLSSEYYYNRLFELSSRNIVMIGKESYNQGGKETLSRNLNTVVIGKESCNQGEKKTCSLHPSFWYLCNKEAAKNKFFYGLNSLADCLAEESLKGQRRLCIRNNILFGIKEAYSSLESISTVRSLLCTGPYHQYPLPICLSSTLLRILDALTIRFYEFPVEILNLVQLKYLALTFSGNLPTFISKLWNLEYLIVHKHMSIIKSSGNSSYLPMEIWDMKELKHLKVIGGNLPRPCEGSLLPNLLTLLDVGPESCTKDVLDKTPHLRKLGILIQLVPDGAKPLSCFDHISNLRNLRSLKCVVMNPKIMSKVVAPPAPLSIFPSRLVKLTLSGLGYPWEEMTKISSLPKLRVLKLRCYAFRGPTWEVLDYEFRCLEFLLIEDTDLVDWTFPHHSGLYELKSLSIRHCYNLVEIPPKLFCQNLKKIELIDCNPLAHTCANELKEDQNNEYGDGSPLLNFNSALDDWNIKRIRVHAPLVR